MTNTTVCSRQKPMSISSITSPINMHSSMRSQQTDYHPDHFSHPIVSTSHLTSDYENRHEERKNRSRNFYSSSPPSFHSSNGSSGDENGNTAIGPLSLQERRIRNKTASAKYREKKNQQHHEMRSMILSLTKENEVLIRQFEQLKSENRSLKMECDKARSKMMATRMLKQMLGHHQQQKDNCELLKYNHTDIDDGGRDVLVNDSDHGEDHPEDTILSDGLFV